jgi:hypothetical protein
MLEMFLVSLRVKFEGCDTDGQLLFQNKLEYCFCIHNPDVAGVNDELLVSIVSNVGEFVDGLPVPVPLPSRETGSSLEHAP